MALFSSDFLQQLVASLNPQVSAVRAIETTPWTFTSRERGFVNNITNNSVVGQRITTVAMKNMSDLLFRINLHRHETKDLIGLDTYGNVGKFSTSGKFADSTSESPTNSFGFLRSGSALTDEDFPTFIPIPNASNAVVGNTIRASDFNEFIDNWRNYWILGHIHYIRENINERPQGT